MGEAMQSEPLNNCHSDGVTPIASSHSAALIFSLNIATFSLSLSIDLCNYNCSQRSPTFTVDSSSLCAAITFTCIMHCSISLFEFAARTEKSSLHSAFIFSVCCSAMNYYCKHFHFHLNCAFPREKKHPTNLRRMLQCIAELKYALSLSIAV